MVLVICQFYFLVFIMSMVSTVRTVRVYDKHYSNSNSDACPSTLRGAFSILFLSLYCGFKGRMGGGGMGTGGGGWGEYKPAI